MNRRLLAVAVGVWALITWGGRVGLLTGPEAEDPTTWARIGGSLLTAGFGVWGLLREVRWAVWLYAAWSVAVWGTSLASVWTTPNTVAFRLMHTGLAVVSLLLAVLAVTAVGGWRPGRRRPQTGQGETA